jgi:RHS repeat-associated protein
LAIILPPECPSSDSEWAFEVPIRENDDESDSIYSRHRHYLSRLGRYNSTDLECIISLYAYASNNPCRYIDPRGLNDEDPSNPKGSEAAPPKATRPSVQEQLDRDSSGSVAEFIIIPEYATKAINLSSKEEVEAYANWLEKQAEFIALQKAEEDQVNRELAAKAREARIWNNRPGRTAFFLAFAGAFYYIVLEGVVEDLLTGGALKAKKIYRVVRKGGGSLSVRSNGGIHVLSSNTSLDTAKCVAADARFIGAGDKLAIAAKWVKPKAGYYDVVVHGTDSTFMYLHNGEWVNVDHRLLSTFIKKSGYQGGNIRLILQRYDFA